MRIRGGAHLDAREPPVQTEGYLEELDDSLTIKACEKVNREAP